MRRVMNSKNNRFVSSPESTGGFGYKFESKIQAYFAALMICGKGLSSCYNSSIVRLSFQTNSSGFNTDDLHILLKDNNEIAYQVLVQIKKTVSYSESNEDFVGMIKDAWEDFNLDRFNQKHDEILFVTGPLSKTDSSRLPWLCNLARHRIYKEFCQTVIDGVATAGKNKEIYSVIKSIIQRYSTIKPTDEVLYRFLSRIYSLQPDNTYSAGIAESFVVALLDEFYGDGVGCHVFDALQCFCGEYNNAGGEVEKNQLIDRLEREKGLKVIVAREQVSESNEKDSLPDPNIFIRKSERRDYMGLLTLVGMWNETHGKDREFLCRVLSVTDQDLDEIIRELSQLQDSVVNVENGIVTIKNRRKVWRKCANHVSQVQVIRFIDEVKSELKLVDTGIEADFSSEQYWTKRNSFASSILRESVAKGMALLAVDLKFCANVNIHIRQAMGYKFVRELLDKADWKLWATINNILQYIAEVDPEAYLHSVDAFIRKRRGGINEIYSREGSGIFARPLFIGLIRSLEVLVWLPNYFNRVLDIVCELARKDPGGQNHPRAIDVFTGAMHPMAPHTWVSSKRRMAFVNSMSCRSHKDISWQLLLQILPNERYSYFQNDTYPIYRANGRSVKVSDRDVNEIRYEFEMCSIAAVKLCGVSAKRVCELLNSAPTQWADESFDVLLDHIGKILKRLNSDERFEIWRSIRIAMNILQFKSEKYVKEDEKDNWIDRRVKLLESLMEKFTPKDIRLRYRVLFTWQDDLYDARLKELSDKEVKKRHYDAIKEMYSELGALEVVKFASTTDKTQYVGYILGEIASLSDDKVLLPKYLENEYPNVYWPITGYIQGRFNIGGWDWYHDVIEGWNKEKISLLLLRLPFTKDVCKRVNDDLASERGLYWANIKHPSVNRVDELPYAVDGLLGVGRGFAAIDLFGILLHKGEECIDCCLKVMRAFIKGEVSDKAADMSSYNVSEIIKVIQKSGDVSDTEKCEIEWMFFDCASWRNNLGFIPKTICKRLANDPEYFCEALAVLFLPEKDAARIKKDLERKPLSEKDQHKYNNIWRLLNNWNVVPGTVEGGGFDAQLFSKWTKKVFSIASKMDRLKSARRVLARVFIHCAQDKDGFWMPHVVAKMLNAYKNDDMRRAYQMQLFNSRGVHFVDKTGEEDKALENKYRLMADNADAEGYSNLASTLRSLANTIIGDWKRSQDEEFVLNTYYDARSEEREKSSALSSDEADD